MRWMTTSAAVAAVITIGGAAGAQALFDVSGQIRLADGLSPRGTRISLQVDLDRDGEFASYETVSATAGGDGTYTVSYELDPLDVDLEFITYVSQVVADYDARGFDSLLDEGPLPGVLTFEREGYSTTVRRFSTNFASPSLDALLAPLQEVQCSASGCQAANGSVMISGFPGGTGIDRGYAQAYDPSLDTPRFPGNFADSDDNLLVSSGFAEIDFRDENGNRVESFSSPLSVRFEAKPDSWSTFVDLEPGTGRIEVPMYSFDDDTAQWVAEQDGELQGRDGTALDEELLPSIVEGDYAGTVFVAFDTAHFSTWNCDRPVQTRTCVKGRIVDESGTPLPGIQVDVQGVSYTGTNGTITTGADGWFATDVMKSEGPDEDVDNNGTVGETFTARVTAGGGAGVFVGAPFDTSTLQRSASGRGVPNCQPSSCDCPTLGDVTTTFEPPRLCEVTVSAEFSGTHIIGDGGPLAAGDAVMDASVRGEITGGVSAPSAATAGICADEQCDSGTSDETGGVTFMVPVIGDAPRIRLQADYETSEDGELHYYSGSATIDGCAPGESSVAEPVALSLDHSSLAGLASFIQALGAGPSPSSTGDDDDDGGDYGLTDPTEDYEGCGCSAAGRTVPGGFWATLAAAGMLALGRRRRRRGRAQQPRASGAQTEPDRTAQAPG
jgi:uncharacterized protein (TIGR03382 family)